MDYLPFTLNTERLLHELAALKPKTLAAMHGSTFVGDGEGALRDLAVVMREVGCQIPATRPEKAHHDELD